MIIRRLLVAASISTAILVGTFHAASASAAGALGIEGNVSLANPYADPAESYYGFRIATGDFNADGIDDMVLSELGNSERFRVLLGKPYDIGGPYPLSRFNGKTVATLKYGSILATGDFNGDGIDEIAIGDRDSASNPGGGGSVYIYRRTAADDWIRQPTIRQGSGAYNGVDESGDKFGSSLASGDFDGDGFDDLAIGVPGKIHVGSPNIQAAGAVHVVYGSATGLTGARDRVFTTANDGLGFVPDSSDQYGYALSAGDIDNDGNDDLAIGVPRRGCRNGGERAGGVVILKGSTSLGLSTLNNQAFQPGLSGLLGNCDSQGDFGHSLSIGKLNGQAYMGLVIGASLADVGGVEKAGAVHIMFGGPSGLVIAGNKFISVTDLPGGVAIPFLQFGSQLVIGSLRSGIASVAISSSRETVNGLTQAGALWVLHSNSGFAINSTLTTERWTASSELGIGPPAANENFGQGIAIGDFNGDNRSDVAIGAYSHDSGGDVNTGGGQVIYQSQYIFTDGFDGD